jgi:phosphoribosylformimino-5-aminoimidazole carboxamide ribotide isomerase
MILIPAIDLLGGKCVRLLRGEYDKATEYSSNPVEVAHVWCAGGAKRIHVVDLDGAKSGQPVNEEWILQIAHEAGVPIEVGGGIRTLDQIGRYLSKGIDRVILGTAAFRDRDLLTRAGQDHPGHVWVGIDGRNGRVAVEGWIEETTTSVYDLAMICEQAGVGGVIFTDIARDGALVGPNLDSLEEMCRKIKIPVIASGGISSLDDLRAIRNLGLSQIEGIITGKALYAGAFTIEEGVEVVEGEESLRGSLLTPG